MREETIDKLQNDYSKLNIKARSSVVKYTFVFNGVKVNVYFDKFDSEVPNLSVILVKDKDYYYSSLNVLNPQINVQYLEDIPLNILERILKDNKLDVFFQEIENHIMTSSCLNTSYKKDGIFKNTMRYSIKGKGRKDLPFLMGCRHVNMTDAAYYRLSATFGIKYEVLDQIREAGLTLVRTSEVDKRKTLTMVLNEIGVKLSD